MQDSNRRADRLERLWLRAWRIAEQHGSGHRVPILRHLALRNHFAGQLDLADFLLVNGNRASFGKFGDGNSPAFLMYRAYRNGSATAAQNLAMTYFWLGEFAEYRRWLRKAAKAGDEDSRHELRQFEQLQPFGLARPMGRLRPFRRYEH